MTFPQTTGRNRDLTQPAPTGWRWLAATLCLGGAYVLAGKLGLLLAIPPGFITAAWPPSGLALAGLLIFGNRVWPAIFLGSCLVNSTLGVHGLSHPSHGWLVTATIGIGATLQGLLGASLLRRTGAYPSPLNEAGAVGRFLVLGGPLACLLSATWGSATLWAAGFLSSSELPFTWWTWWVGDSIGVLAFTPLVLVWGGNQGRSGGADAIP